MPFSATAMYLQIIIFSEVSQQKKTNITQYHYMWKIFKIVI